MKNERSDKIGKINQAIATLQAAITDVIEEKEDVAKVPLFEEDRMSKREAAKFLDVSIMTLDRLARDGKLKKYSLGHRKFFLKSEIIESLKNQ